MFLMAIQGGSCFPRQTNCIFIPWGPVKTPPAQREERQPPVLVVDSPKVPDREVEQVLLSVVFEPFHGQHTASYLVLGQNMLNPVDHEIFCYQLVLDFVHQQYFPSACVLTRRWLEVTSVFISCCSASNCSYLSRWFTMVDTDVPK